MREWPKINRPLTRGCLKLREWINRNYGDEGLVEPTEALFGQGSKGSRSFLRHILVGRKRPSITTASLIRDATGIAIELWGDENEVAA